MVTELSQALTLDEQAQLQERLMLLLASRVRYATQGDSSSVSQEYAQALLEGVVFALQTHLQAQGLPARALLEPPLQALYEEALSTLQGLLDQVRALYLRACETAPVFPNRTLHDTLQAIEGFLGKYDYRMFPQDSHCTLDYPLCLPIAPICRACGAFTLICSIFAWKTPFCCDFHPMRRLTYTTLFLPIPEIC